MRPCGLNVNLPSSIFLGEEAPRRRFSSLKISRVTFVSDAARGAVLRSSFVSLMLNVEPPSIHIYHNHSPMIAKPAQASGSSR